ncbi:MAG: hypothetical protein SWH68_14780 [Thermodesulfobacteriota bacterium]|nr:hypothetical protein [Thermodesulfobacteriota bacterium]
MTKTDTGMSRNINAMHRNADIGLPRNLICQFEKKLPLAKHAKIAENEKNILGDLGGLASG